MKKILFVVNDAAFFISHRLPIARQLVEEGHDVHLATSGETLSLYDELGLNFHKIEVSRRGTSPINEFRLIWKLFKLCSGLKPDLVHLVTIKPYLYGGIAARLMDVPAVISAVSGLGALFIHKDMKSKFLRFILNPFYKLAFNHSNQKVIIQNKL